ncbi:MAG: molybdopterin cofactor-binding domain-containing protein [Steroidobacteraceae bacterium]
MNAIVNTENEYYPPVILEQIAQMEKLERESMNPLAGPVSRRSFMKVSAGAGGGLILAFGFGMSEKAEAQAAAGAAPARPAGPPGPAFNPSAYVRIAPDGKVTLVSKNPEIGQGIKTAFGVILAEELDAKWSDVTIEQAPINSAVYGTQFAGGSLSIPSAYTTLRQAGAGARAMLVAAAAQQWGVPQSEITTSEGVVKHAGSNRSATYGELANAAAALPVPDVASLKLKDRKDFKLMGKRTTGFDNPGLVTGKGMFGVDVQLPNMKVAVFEKCPAVYGKVVSANLDEIRKLPGVVDAFILEGTGSIAEVIPGVAIVANNTWAAFSAKKKLKVVWDETNASKDSWTALSAQAEVARKSGAGAQELKKVGDVDAAFSGAKKTVEAYYTFGFVGHQPLEPQNTTAWYQKDPEGDKLELWAPVQIPDGARTLAAKVVGVAPTRSVLHQTRVGGGFGRRLSHEYACEAAAISKQAGGVPVKLMWTREDDLTHDIYRSGGFHAFKAGLDEKGRLTAWTGHVISFTDSAAPASAPAAPAAGGAPQAPRAPRAVAGGGWPSPNEFPAEYTPNYRLTQTLMPIKTPCGPWRAPTSNTTGWLVQSFMHELSVAAKRDHAEFLIEVFGQKQAPPPAAAGAGGGFGGGGLNPDRAKAVILAAVERSGYGKPLPKGHFHGLAFHFSHQGHFAEVAEVSVDKKKKVTLHKMTVVGDIGPIVNLSGAENQVQGCVVDALSTLALEVTIENGRIKEQNFDTYKIARMPVAPQVDVHFLDTNFPPTGVGEPAFPPAGPAICNAIYAATKERIRTMPITRQGFSIA